MGSIICGVDGSESARRAARVARGLSSKLGLDLLFVRVLENGAAGERVDTTAARLEHLNDTVNAVDSGAVWLVEVGHPADRLVAAAAERGASFIVVGSHGPRASLLGSISAEVSRRATCPVVVVPPGADGGLNGDPQGGIARFEIGGGVTDSAGGIARFGLGSRRA
jgi:nucleotide-binding universal stress UspA family protein